MISLHHGAWNLHGREACLHPALAEKFSLTLHTGVSCSCSYSCSSSLEAFPIFQKILTYQMPNGRFTVLQGCWFYLLCCDTILKSYTKARWATWRKPVSLSTAGLFSSSRHFCSFPDLKQWSSRVTPLFGWNKTLLWVCLAFVKESERLKHKMLDSGYSWVKSACKCNCGQKTWAVCRAVFSSALYLRQHLFSK